MNKKNATSVGILIFLFMVGWVAHVFAFTPFIQERTVQAFSMQTTPENSPDALPAEFMPSRPHLSNANNKVSIASASCPDHLIQTRGNVLAFRTYEGSSATNPHVFPSYEDYLEYADSMKFMYNCPVLTANEDAVAPSASNAVIVPTYASDDSPFLKRTRESTGFFLARPRGIDPVGHYNWDYTIDDEKNRARREDQPISDVPGDPNWGGPEYTEYILATGKHDGSTVVMNRPVINYQTKL